MAETSFAQNLKSALDVKSINQYFVEDRGKTEQVLTSVRPEGRIDGGRFKLASVAGGAGGSFDYNLQNGHWGDWAAGDSRHGLVGFVSATMKCSAAQAVQFLIDKKFLVKAEAKKSLTDAEGDPLILPIPVDKQPWEYVLEQDVLRKDRGILKSYWTYRDMDGSLLGYKYRVDQRNTNKEVYTLTYRAESGWAKKAWQKKLIPPYGLEYLNQGPTVRVLFVEGEKAADKAREILGSRWKVLSFSGVSAANDLWLPDEDFWTDCEVILWPDNDVAGREASRKLQLSLEALENKPREIRIVRVETIAGLPPKWDLGDWEEGCGVDVRVELERAEVVDSFDRVCREWVYVTQQDQFHNLEDRGLIWSTAAFDKRYSRYSDKSGSASKKFLSTLENLKVDDLEFVPGEGTFVTTAQGKTFLNEWYPSETYREAKRIAEDSSISLEEIEENCKHFRAHLKRLTADQEVEPEKNVKTQEIIPETVGRELSDALAFYFSSIVKRPMDKHGWIPMLLSENNGTGKSYILKLLERIHGGARCAVVTVQQYIGQYHDWKDGLLFYELGEAKHQENTQVYEELKKNHNHTPFDFSANSDRQAGAQKLNIKTRGMKVQRDFLNGYITANDLYPLALSSGGNDGSDRRLLVIRCETVLSDEEQVNLFDEEMKKKAEWIGAWLMRYEPKYRWSPSWAPITEHKRKMFEKDRERQETRTDKYELGKYDEFFHFIDWAAKDRVGGFARKVITSEVIREICDNRRIKFPYSEARFNKILERAGILRGPDVELDGEIKRLYTTHPEMLCKPDKAWRDELKANLAQSAV